LASQRQVTALCDHDSVVQPTDLSTGRPWCISEILAEPVAKKQVCEAPGQSSWL
jgi:hypothetical protein